MSDTAWLAIATFAAAVLGFIGCLLTLRKDRRALRDTQSAVSEIHEKVGNGFAQEVIDALGKVNGGIDALRIQVGIANSRINAHINQHSQGVYAKRKPQA